MGEIIILSNHRLQFAPLAETVYAAFAGRITGLSTGPKGATIGLADAPRQSDALRAQAIVDAHGLLAVTADQVEIRADGADTATITCSDARVANDAAVTVTVWLDNKPFMAAADVAVEGGRVQLALAVADAGSYLVEIKRRGAGNYESGYLKIEAV